MTSHDSTVRIMRCEEYDRDHLEAIVTEGMQALGYRPAGDIFVKPNVVFAGDPAVYGSDACTSPAVVGAALRALGGRGAVERVSLGENSGVGFPTRYCFRQAGYYDEVAAAARRSPAVVDILCLDEDRRDTVFVGGRVHDTLRLSRRLVRADSKVYLPKLKCHCVCRMTGAVKLNIGICSDDERSVRHDFLLNEKIVDLLSVGWPDFIVMDAIDVGVGNEAFPKLRRLGLILLGRNPLAVDLVGARLLGLGLDDVPYLEAAVARGYGPRSLDEVELQGDLTSLAELAEQAERIMPYDDDFTAWQDVEKELSRLGSPLRFVWGPYRPGGDRCLYGCVMALKMFLAAYERYPGPEALATAAPVTFVIGRPDEVIDGRGHEVILIGSCARAEVRNAKEVIKLDKCFTTASDMNLAVGHRLGMPAPLGNPKLALPLLAGMARASLSKVANLRYAEDVAHFVTKKLIRRV